MPKPKLRTVKVQDIVVDQHAQTRADRIDDTHVAQMVDDVKDLPPVLCVEFDGQLKLADGFHRMEAYRRAKMIRVAVLVIVGTEDDWIDAFGSANDDQKGKHRTREDKRASVVRVLEMRPSWTNRRIAEAAKVSHELVNKMRQPTGNVASSSDGSQVATLPPEPTREGKDGKEYPAQGRKVTATPPIEVAPEPEPVVVQETAPEPEPVSELIPAPAATEPADTPEPDEQPLALAFSAELESWCRDADQLAGRIVELKKSPLHYSVHLDSALAQVKGARSTLWQGRPAFACPYCTDAGEVDLQCRACRGNGYVKKTTYDAGKESVGGGK